VRRPRFRISRLNILEHRPQQRHPYHRACRPKTAKHARPAICESTAGTRLPFDSQALLWPSWRLSKSCREPRIGQVSFIESREVLGDLLVRNVLAEECRDVFQRDSRALETRFPAENVRRRSDSLLAPAIRGHVSLDGFAEMLALNEYLHVTRAKHDVRPVRNPMPRGLVSVGEYLS
jgi:hypothetical protein